MICPGNEIFDKYAASVRAEFTRLLQLLYKLGKPDRKRSKFQPRVDIMNGGKMPAILTGLEFGNLPPPDKKEKILAHFGSIVNFILYGFAFKTF